MRHAGRAHGRLHAGAGAVGYYAGLFESILPEHVLGDMTTEEIVNYTPYNRGDELVGTGPFRFAEWRAGEYIRVVRNDDYWRGSDTPRIDEIVWSFIPDSQYTAQRDEGRPVPLRAPRAHPCR